MIRSIWYKKDMAYDSSVDILYSVSLRSWGETLAAYKHSSKKQFKSDIRARICNEIFEADEFLVLRLFRPRLLVLRINALEYKIIVQTRNGNLVRCPHESRWDYVLPSNFMNLLRGTSQYSAAHVECFKLNGEFVYSPHSYNYTHFLYEFLTPLHCLYSLADCFGSKHVDLLSFCGQIPDWQRDFILASQIVASSKLIEIPIGSFMIFEPELLVVPIKTNKISTPRFLQAIMTRKRAPQPPRTSLIFCTRNDQRRQRIANIHEVESMVISMGGIVVDPSRLSFVDKACIFGAAKVVIAESSASMNPFLFSETAHVIVPAALQSVLDLNLFYGGTIHNLGLLDRYEYLECKMVRNVEGFVMPQIIVPIEILRKTIARLLCG